MLQFLRSAPCLLRGAVSIGPSFNSLSFVGLYLASLGYSATIICATT